MFTGIIEQKGKVLALDANASGARLHIIPASPLSCKLGQSVSVSGACLTVAMISHGELSFDLAEETLRRTTLGSLKAGDSVNLEQALQVGSRLGGHFVSGHVDGLGKLLAIRPAGEAAEYDFELPAELHKYVAHKGSIAVDGVSLTPWETTRSGFSVALIPHTLKTTTLGLLKAGDAVNIEIYVLARYVERLREAL